MSLIGHGTQFELLVGSSYIAIQGVLSVEFGSNKVDTHDTTDMLSTGSTRTFIGGLENPGDASAKLNFLPGDSTQAALTTAKDGTVHSFRVIYPGAIQTDSFDGIITAIDKSDPDDKLLTKTCKIQISGPVTSM